MALLRFIMIFGMMLLSLFSNRVSGEIDKVGIEKQANDSNVSNNKIYTFGVVPQFEQRKLFKIWRPILDLLEKKTQLKFRLKGSSKIPEFEQNVFAGLYDFAYMNPYHFVKAQQRVGYIPLVRDGGRKLKGIIVVAESSRFHKLEDLNKAVISFPSPNALGASLLTRADLVNQFKIDFTAQFVKTHTSVYLHVALGLTDAGGGILSTLESQKVDLRNKLRILYTTRSVNPHPLAVHPRIDKKIGLKVMQGLIEISQSNQGKALFKKIPINHLIEAKQEDYQELSTWGLDEFWVE